MGDVVGVVMDTMKGDLSFALNGMNLGVAYEGIPLDKPLVPCVILSYRGDSVELDTSEVKETVIDSSIPVPSNTSVKNIISWDTLIFSWDAVGKASFYQVELDGSVFSVIGSKSFSKRDLLPGTEHAFRVRAIVNDRVGEWSSVVKGKTREESFENSGWKECPGYVDHGKMVYPIDRNNPRIAKSRYRTRFIGNTPLPTSKITVWNIKISRSYFREEGNTYIGIAPSDINQNEDNNYYECGWYINDYDLTLISGPPHNFRNKKYKEKSQALNTIGVVMDTTKGDLSFALNDVNLGVAYEGIPLDKPLVPCVYVGSRDVSVELII